MAALSRNMRHIHELALARLQYNNQPKLYGRASALKLIYFSVQHLHGLVSLHWGKYVKLVWPLFSGSEALTVFWFVPPPQVSSDWQGVPHGRWVTSKWWMVGCCGLKNVVCIIWPAVHIICGTTVVVCSFYEFIFWPNQWKHLNSMKLHRRLSVNKFFFLSCPETSKLATHVTTTSKDASFGHRGVT